MLAVRGGGTLRRFEEVICLEKFRIPSAVVGIC